MFNSSKNVFLPLDAMAIDGFPNAIGVPAFLGDVNCLGSEDQLRSCTAALPAAACDNTAGVSCGTSSCEVPAIFELFIHVICLVHIL